MTSNTAWIILFITVALHSISSKAVADGEPDTNYFRVIRQELARLEIDARCNETTASCAFTRTVANSERRLDLFIKYSVKTDTVYIYIDNFVQLVSRDGPSTDLARRLLELNREMVTAKFEWDRGTNTVRLSVTLNTDSNLDRRAFRSQLLGLISLAKKIWPELSEVETKAKLGTVDGHPSNR